MLRSAFSALKKAALLAIMLAGVSVSPLAAEDIAAPPKTETPQASALVDKVEIDARINDLMRRPEMVGLSIAIIENGQITFAKGYGQTEKGGDAVTADTVFRWASVSKGVQSFCAFS